MNEAVQRLWHRARSALAFGMVNVVDDSGPVQKAQIGIGERETHDNLPVIFHFGFTSGLPQFSDVAVSFVAGDRSNGAIIGSNHQTLRARNLAPGETMIYDSLGRQVYLSAAGIRVIANNSPVTIENATTLTATATVKMRFITPRLEVTGDVIDNCDTQTETAANWRSIYDSHTHHVTGVGTETNGPTQQET